MEEKQAAVSHCAKWRDFRLLDRDWASGVLPQAAISEVVRLLRRKLLRRSATCGEGKERAT